MAATAAQRIQAELSQSSARDALRRARARLRTARARRAEARRTLMRWYRSAKARLRERARVYRAAERERINREIAGWWAELRASWQRRREQIHELGGRGVEKAKRVAEHERVRLRELAGHRRRVSAQWAEHKRREQQAESDEEVIRNLEAHHPELVAVFREIRQTIKAGPRRSRTEAMLEWAEENPDEILARRAKHDDDEIARMVREHEEAERELAAVEQAPKSRRRPAAATAKKRQPSDAELERKAIGRLKFELGPVEILTGRYSRRTVTVLAPEGGRAVYEAAWDTTDSNPRPELRRLEPPEKSLHAPPVEVKQAAEKALWDSLRERHQPRKTKPKSARRQAAAVPF